MGKTCNKFEQNISALNSAKGETPFGAEDLVMEIEPLMRDYFVGAFERKAKR